MINITLNSDVSLRKLVFWKSNFDRLSINHYHKILATSLSSSFAPIKHVFTFEGMGMLLKMTNLKSGEPLNNFIMIKKNIIWPSYIIQSCGMRHETYISENNEDFSSIIWVDLRTVFWLGSNGASLRYKGSLVYHISSCRRIHTKHSLEERIRKFELTQYMVVCVEISWFIRKIRSFFPSYQFEFQKEESSWNTVFTAKTFLFSRNNTPTMPRIITRVWKLEKYILKEATNPQK